jgi:hypothetical protein
MASWHDETMKEEVGLSCKARRSSSFGPRAAAL